MIHLKIIRNRITTTLAAVVFVLVSGWHTVAQAPAPKDPTALAILQLMTQATGWNPATMPSDALAVGTVTPGTSQTPYNITLKVRGPNQLRAEVLNGNSLTTTIVNNGLAAIIYPDGTASFLPPEVVLSMWPVALPLFSDISVASTDPAVALSYIGTSQVNGRSVQQLQIARQPSANDPLAGAKSVAFPITLWVDSNTDLPAQIQYAVIATTNPTAHSARTRVFSNYQTINGVAVPFTQQELSGGQVVSALQFNSVQFNVGLTDADFTLPTAQ